MSYTVYHRIRSTWLGILVISPSVGSDTILRAKHKIREVGALSIIVPFFFYIFFYPNKKPNKFEKDEKKLENFGDFSNFRPFRTLSILVHHHEDRLRHQFRHHKQLISIIICGNGWHLGAAMATRQEGGEAVGKRQVAQRKVAALKILEKITKKNFRGWNFEKKIEKIDFGLKIRQISHFKGKEIVCLEFRCPK